MEIADQPNENTIPESIAELFARLKAIEKVGEEVEEDEKYLAAYIVWAEGVEAVSEKKPGTTELREYLSLTLPDYMLPSFFMQVMQIPLSA